MKSSKLQHRANGETSQVSLSPSTSFEYNSLQAYGNFETDKCKYDFEATLKSTLKGVQCVPTIILLNPTGKLSDLNLEEYTIFFCEPLHDLKGHLINMCK